MNFAVSLPEEVMKEFCRRYRVRRLSLFGSVLRKNFSPTSDVDGLVEFELDAAVGFLMLARIARELSTLFGRKVGLVLRNGLKSLIRETVLREEQVVYAS
ncbi:MAG: nucleotidyltransferase domain-containing protein [Acidobacteriota bacterium]|nr:nucleotidyltransferase domain-containing protein [Blastocatellia bacterium]MDW8411472.1 nucleotidyltransferase domain-containing protein [Acidobacteriota bacterium]